MATNNKLVTDPKLIGPGAWFTIHIMAKNATNRESKDAFINFMNLLRDTFPCQKCRKHINEYMDNNHIEDFYNIKDNKGNEIGMFKYSWLFHNTVNTRLDKPFLDWDTAWAMYSEDNISVCDAGCDGNNDNMTSIYKSSNSINSEYFSPYHKEYNTSIPITVKGQSLGFHVTMKPK